MSFNPIDQQSSVYLAENFANLVLSLSPPAEGNPCLVLNLNLSFASAICNVHRLGIVKTRRLDKIVAILVHRFHVSYQVKVYILYFHFLKSPLITAMNFIRGVMKLIRGVSFNILQLFCKQIHVFDLR